ncbi:hypothetical protein AVEN_116690-1 [Araneus ventricosus]|uniref:Uncharacterized protein n=1 Tax=Araneus ventricosus TaxID=182803 RepID=A0A4Y2EHQ0_ARAVE|nr:hypothetical protein AVEN_116690-1 [Araneus ventricosus]
MKIHIIAAKTLPQPLRAIILFIAVTFVDIKRNVVTELQTAHEGQKRAVEKIIESSGKKLKPVAVRDFILLNVPKVDRGPLDCPNLIGKNLKVENNV